jgi:hypothetical protein
MLYFFYYKESSSPEKTTAMTRRVYHRALMNRLVAVRFGSGSGRFLWTCTWTLRFSAASCHTWTCTPRFRFWRFGSAVHLGAPRFRNIFQVYIYFSSICRFHNSSSKVASTLLFITLCNTRKLLSPGMAAMSRLCRDGGVLTWHGCHIVIGDSSCHAFKGI